MTRFQLMLPVDLQINRWNNSSDFKFVQKIFTTGFLGQNIYTPKMRKSRLLLVNECKIVQDSAR